MNTCTHRYTSISYMSIILSLKHSQYIFFLQVSREYTRAGQACACADSTLVYGHVHSLVFFILFFLNNLSCDNLPYVVINKPWYFFGKSPLYCHNWAKFHVEIPDGGPRIPFNQWPPPMDPTNRELKEFTCISFSMESPLLLLLLLLYCSL